MMDVIIATAGGGHRELHMCTRNTSHVNGSPIYDQKTLSLTPSLLVGASVGNSDVVGKPHTLSPPSQMVEVILATAEGVKEDFTFVPETRRT